MMTQFSIFWVNYYFRVRYLILAYHMYFVSVGHTVDTLHTSHLCIYGQRWPMSHNS